jgi:pimeloyl-ACP methyl ester carboxylesterase
MPTISVRGQDLYYSARRAGETTVLLIHGAGGSRLNWPASLRRLPWASVYTVDLPGHGRSGDQGRDSIDEYATDLLALMDQECIERAVLVGHSMGGAIAQTMAATAPRSVLGLALLGTGARLRVAQAILDGLQDDFEGTVDLITGWLWGESADERLVAEGRQTMLAAGPAVMLGDFLACDRFDLRERVASVSAPTLVLTGSEDRMTPPKLGQWLADNISGARFSLVQGSGHMLMLEQPDVVTAAIGGFVDRLE